MLRHSRSLISLATLQPDTEPYHDDWAYDVPSLAVSAARHAAEADNSLCSRCQKFDIQSFAKRGDKRKGYLLKDVETAAVEGCQFCKLLSDAVKDIKKLDYFYSNAFMGRTTLNPDLYVHMTVSDSYRDDKESALSGGLRANRLLVELGDRFSGIRSPSNHEICIAADSQSPAALNGDVLGRYIGGDPTSDSHYETAKGWLQACSSHSKCNETVSGSLHINPYEAQFPTRVIEIVRENGQQRLFLRHTDGLKGAYITLTHRWNDFTGKCITTTSNLEERLLGGDFGELPQLFRDVFVIAENLEVNFIWIDSICIIQQGDDYVDWRREAPKMAQYYQFSVFTLAGTAEDIVGGLFQPYAEDAIPWSSKLVRLPYRDKNDSVAGSFYCFKIRTPIVEEYIDQVWSSILFRRGWILQEWLLSKRLLWYTPHGLFFECQQELPRAYDQAQLTFNRASADLQAYLSIKASFHHSNNDILSFWYSVLEVYSGQSLTKNSDRILAVAGLAKEVASILASPKRIRSTNGGSQNEVYVAGLWLRGIHRGLLWEEQHAATPWTKKVEGAPSWSWVSLITLVRWPGKGNGTRPALAVTGLCFEPKGRHDIPDHLVVDGCRLRSCIAMTERPTFDPTNMFTCIHIRGKLHTVHVRGYLETEENLKNAALATSYSPLPKSCNWRAICSTFSPDIIVGWGSMEQLSPFPNACSDFGVAVYALHVSTRYLTHGLWIKTLVPVYDVLFVEEMAAGTNSFRRLGVGRIFDGQMINEFERVEERDFHLI